MRKVFHSIFSMSLAFVVLFSTLSFTFNMHYCGGTLVETVLFKQAKGCGMEMNQPSTKSCSVTKKNCCDNKQLVVEGQDELKVQFDKITLEQQTFIASLVYTYINLFEGFDKEINTFRDYKPPLVIRQIFKIDETYLI